MNKNFFSSGRWKDLFVFSRREKSGILVLLFILAAEACTLLWLHYRPFPKQSPGDFSAFEKEADAFFASIQKVDTLTTERPFPSREETHKEQVTMFHFNPNDLSSEKWEELGVSVRLAATLEKYVSKGGRFREKEDLQKIYGMTTQEYKRLSPYVLLPVRTKPAAVSAESHTRNKPERFTTPVRIDVGIADTVELTRIHGIGVVFARRIHNYRERLGGFYSVEQVREVYGMTDTLFEKILPQITLGDTGNVRLLDINTAGYATLKNHPYVGRDMAVIILNYRQQHGAFRNSGDVRKIPLVTDELYRKLAPYFKME